MILTVLPLSITDDSLSITADSLSRDLLNTAVFFYDANNPKQGLW